MKYLSEQRLQQLAEGKKPAQINSEQSSTLAAYRAVNDYLQNEEIPSLSQNFADSMISVIQQRTEIKMGVLEWGAILITIFVSLSCIGLAINWGDSINWETSLFSFSIKNFDESWVSLFCVLLFILTWGNIETLLDLRNKFKKTTV